MLRNDMVRRFVELRKIHKLFEEQEARLVQKLGVPICIPNCGKCCQENNVTAYAIEASLILSFTMGSNISDVINWCRDWLLEKHTVTPTYEGIPRGILSEKLKHEWEILAHTQCPMLKQDKTCIIHSSRPLVCRAYGITRNAGVGCPRPLSLGESVYSKRIVTPQESDFLEDAVMKYFGILRAESPDFAVIGFLPTMIFRQAREKEFRELIAENKIASAKLIGTDVETQVLFEKYALPAENIIVLP